MDEGKKSTLEDVISSSDVAANKIADSWHRTMAMLPRFNRPPINSPEFRMPELPSQEEVNDYQSASILIDALVKEAFSWRDLLPENYRPVVVGILYGGTQIYVHTLTKISFHGIRIEGTINGAPCSLLTHQSTVQLLCYAEELQPETERFPIGFVWDDNKVELE